MDAWRRVLKVLSAVLIGAAAAGCCVVPPHGPRGYYQGGYVQGGYVYPAVQPPPPVYYGYPGYGRR